MSKNQAEARDSGQKQGKMIVICPTHQRRRPKSRKGKGGEKGDLRNAPARKAEIPEREGSRKKALKKRTSAEGRNPRKGRESKESA